MLFSVNTLFTTRAIASTAVIAFVVFSMMFLPVRVFVEPELTSKWYMFIGGSVVCFAACLVSTPRPRISIDTITILCGAFMGYLLFRVIVSESPINMMRVMSYVAFVALFLTFKLICSRNLSNFNIITIAVCVAQAFYGVLQYLGVFYTKGAWITGSFDNPAGFAACLAAGFPICLSVVERKGWLRYLGAASATTIALAIMLSGARAGIITILIVAILYLDSRYWYLIKRYRKYLWIPSIMCALLAIGLFFLKRDSAVGRMLIWKNTTHMIADKPLLGHGSGGFMSKYMEYQADYFAANPDSAYTVLADNVTHPFNEYLLLWAEYGLIGLLLLLIAFVVVIKNSRQISTPILCLGAIAILSCFSYPLR